MKEEKGCYAQLDRREGNGREGVNICCDESCSSQRKFRTFALSFSQISDDGGWGQSERVEVNGSILINHQCISNCIRDSDIDE